MLKLSKALTVSQALGYFVHDYRSPGPSIPGRREGHWWGRTAQRLGLAGEPVRAPAYTALVQGFSPDGTELVRASPGKHRCFHRVGWDALLCASKSVSLQALVGGDERILYAFEDNADRALGELEQFAQARAGADRNRLHPTRNLLVACFTHTENRSLEPHLHRHQVAMNITFDPFATDRDGSPGSYRALQERGLFQAQALVTAVFRAGLARDLATLGYRLTVDAHGAPQLADVPEKVCRHFSSRAAEIDVRLAQVRAQAEALGIPWTRRRAAQAKEYAGKQTRRAKDSMLDPEALRRGWQEECRRLGFDPEELAAQARACARHQTPEQLHLQNCQRRTAVGAAVTLAAEYTCERQRGFLASELAPHCLTQPQLLGLYTLAEVRAEICQRVRAGDFMVEESPELYPDQRLFLVGDTRLRARVPTSRADAELLEHEPSPAPLRTSAKPAREVETIGDLVAALAEGRVRDALHRLLESGRVYQSSDVAHRYSTIAALYTAMPGETQVLCATNDERRQLNAAIRTARIEKGQVAERGSQTEVYLPKCLTGASRKAARHYDRGDKIRFGKVGHTQLQPGIWYTVVSRDLLKNQVTVRSEEGTKVTYDPRLHEGIGDVYAVEQRIFAIGDKIVCCGTNPACAISSGQIGTIYGIREDGTLGVKGRTGRRTDIPLRHYKTLDYAYASNDPRVCSPTVANLILLLTSVHAKNVVAHLNASVGTGRARHELFVVVDHLDRTIAALERSYERAATRDVVAVEGREEQPLLLQQSTRPPSHTHCLELALPANGPRAVPGSIAPP